MACQCYANSWHHNEWITTKVGRYAKIRLCTFQNSVVQGGLSSVALFLSLAYTTNNYYRFVVAVPNVRTPLHWRRSCDTKNLIGLTRRRGHWMVVALQSENRWRVKSMRWLLWIRKKVAGFFSQNHILSKCWWWHTAATNVLFSVCGPTSPHPHQL